MAHEHNVYDSDPHFTIDPDTRVLSHNSPEKLTMMQGDHNSEVYTFEIPKTVDGHDMTLCNRVEIHYINIDGNKPSSRSTGIYTVTDLQAKKDDQTRLVCSWTISSKATKYAGPLNFVIRFLCVTEEEVETEYGPEVTRTIDYAWSTAIFKDISIISSLDNAEDAEEEYHDILDDWYTQIANAAHNVINTYEEIKDLVPEPKEFRFYRHSVLVKGDAKQPLILNGITYSTFGTVYLVVSVITKSSTPFTSLEEACAACIGEHDKSMSVSTAAICQGRITTGPNPPAIVCMVMDGKACYSITDNAYSFELTYAKVTSVAEDVYSLVPNVAYVFNGASITDTVVEIT